MSARERAVARLRDERTVLATRITALLYEELPHLQVKYGDRGRARCLEDMHFNLEHLGPAVDLERPDLFASYVRWLDGLLRARGIDTFEVTRSLHLTRHVLAEVMTADEMAAVLPSLDAGLSAIVQDAGAAR